MDITITPHKLHGNLMPPPSKSQAHRALIAAALAGGVSTLGNLAESQDIVATRSCLAALMGERPFSDDGLPRLDCGESGSTLRFLIPVALALRGGGHFSGRGRLMERPQEPYFAIFRDKEIFYQHKDGILTVRGELTPGTYPLPGDVSSQFVTGLLYSLPLLPGDSDIVLTTDLESHGYVDMTLDVLDRFGITVEVPNARTFHIPGRQHYRPHNMTIESDYSQAAFWYTANGLGSAVDIQGLNPDSVQGDRRIIPYCQRLCDPGPVELDVSQCPDLVPALALHAALRAGETTAIVGAARLRIKESDRLDTVTTELSKLGANIEQAPDSLLIHGVERLTGGETDSHNDHRIAMMLAVAATRAAAPVTIHGAESVRKSYPNFWEDYKSVGGILA